MAVDWFAVREWREELNGWLLALLILALVFGAIIGVIYGVAKALGA